MNIDFHYYAVRVLAHYAGFEPDEAHVIACASQYVDNSTEGDPIRLKGQEYCFDPVRTAWMHLESTGTEVQRMVYMPFHFVSPRRAGELGHQWFTHVVEPGAALPLAMFEPVGDEDEEIRLHRLLRNKPVSEQPGDEAHLCMKPAVSGCRSFLRCSARTHNECSAPASLGGRKPWRWTIGGSWTGTSGGGAGPRRRPSPWLTTSSDLIG